MIRARLRSAADELRREQVEENPLPRILFERMAVNVLLAQAAMVFARYGLRVDPPVSNVGRYSFGGTGSCSLTVEALGAHIQGTLREAPPEGGAVRAISVDIVQLAWDPALGCLVPTEAATETALELLVVNLLRVLRL